MASPLSPVFALGPRARISARALTRLSLRFGSFGRTAAAQRRAHMARAASLRPRRDRRLRRKGVGGRSARPHCAPAARRAPPAQRRGRAFGPATCAPAARRAPAIGREAHIAYLGTCLSCVGGRSEIWPLPDPLNNLNPPEHRQTTRHSSSSLPASTCHSWSDCWQEQIRSTGCDFSKRSLITAALPLKASHLTPV